jgi:hypothetical protein
MEERGRTDGITGRLGERGKTVSVLITITSKIGLKIIQKESGWVEKAT